MNVGRTDRAHLVRESPSDGPQVARDSGSFVFDERGRKYIDCGCSASGRLRPLRLDRLHQQWSRPTISLVVCPSGTICGTFRSGGLSTENARPPSGEWCRA